MNSASEFMHDGTDRLVWHKNCMSLFCLSLGESELRGFVHHWGCDHWGHASLVTYSWDSVTLRLRTGSLCFKVGLRVPESQ